jgi:hypothetical protein
MNYLAFIQSIPLRYVPLWLLVAGLPLAMVFWVIRRFLHRPRLSIWQGVAGLLLWLSMIGMFYITLLAAIGGHGMSKASEIVSTTILLVQLVACVWLVWYLYEELGFR